MNTYIDENDTFHFDHKSPIFIENIEFHFDYDIILQRATNSTGEVTYSAHYDMSEVNRISNITEPYLVQPFQMKISSDEYIIFQAEVRQYTIEETQDRIISESTIENKTYTFEFDNQLADFDVYATSNGSTVRLRPYYYGSAIDEEDTMYCWYEYIADNTVRITFDSLSYIPAMNTTINIVAYTTLGRAGDFTYNLNPAVGGLYIDLSSDTYGYDNITCFLIPVGDSTGGSDRKTKQELQKQIPIMRFQRDNIATDQDMINYFKLGDTDKQRIVPSKKIDNQSARTWFAYLVMKDNTNNVVPTNTINLQCSVDSRYFIHAEDGRYILPAGTVFYLQDGAQYAELKDASFVPPAYTDQYYNLGYFYTNMYNIMVDTEPLSVAYYLTLTNKNQNLIFNWINNKAILQFVSTISNFKRTLYDDFDDYTLTFSAAQSLSTNYYLCTVDPTTGAIISNKMAVVLVMYNEDGPYRWIQATLSSYDVKSYVANWSIVLTTNNTFDTSNNIYIDKLHASGGSYTEETYGFMQPTTKAKLYFLVQMADVDTGYNRYDLDSIAPGAFDGTNPDNPVPYSVTNVYEIKDGLTFYTNFTNIINSKINDIDGSPVNFTIDSIPVVGMHYALSPDNVFDLITALHDDKEYIDECIKKVDATTDIDFKFYNTYGHSYTYTLDDATEEQPATGIGHVDITLKFRVSIKSTNDIYTKDDILKFIKEYIENLDDIGDLHFPNMITTITNKFADRINYIEYITFNDFAVNKGVQHIILKDNLSILEVPEFINIRNHYDSANNVVPWIDLEVLF